MVIPPRRDSVRQTMSDHRMFSHAAFTVCRLRDWPIGEHRKTLPFRLFGLHYESRCNKTLRGHEEAIMRERLSGSMITVAVAGAAVGVVISVSVTQTSAQAPAASVTAPATAPALRTPWGEPDLQGIW